MVGEVLVDKMYVYACVQIGECAYIYKCLFVYFDSHKKKHNDTMCRVSCMRIVMTTLEIVTWYNNALGIA